MLGPSSTKSLQDKCAERTERRARERAYRQTMPGPQADILALQDAAGNRAVNQVLRSDTGNAARIQAKLTINAPEDQYEQEADRVAEQVIQMKVKPYETEDLVQQKSRQQSNVSGTSVSNSFLHQLGPGQPLSPSTRAFFEPRFGSDFANVRVHTATCGSDVAHSVAAHAFTVGSDIVFDRGKYTPHTPQGQKLLAHELTHVVQQRAGLAPVGIQRQKKGLEEKEPKKREKQRDVPKPSPTETPGRNLEDVLDAVSDAYSYIILKQRDAVKDLYESAKKSKEPSSLLMDALLLTAEVALEAVTGGTGAFVAETVGKKLGQKIADGLIKEVRGVDTVKIVQDQMKEIAKNQVKKGGKKAVKNLIDEQKTPMEAYFQGQRDFYTDQSFHLSQEFDVKGKQKIRNAPQPLDQAEVLRESINEQYANAYTLARNETLRGWLSYLPKSRLGIEKGAKGEEQGTRLASHSDLFTPLLEPKVPGLLYLFTDKSPDPVIESARLPGADSGLRAPLKGRKLEDLRIPFVIKSNRYEIMVNEKGLPSWDPIRTNFSWLAQFARTKRIGGGAVMKMAAEGAMIIIERIKRKILPAVSD